MLYCKYIIVLCCLDRGCCCTKQARKLTNRHIVPRKVVYFSLVDSSSPSLGVRGEFAPLIRFDSLEDNVGSSRQTIELGLSDKQLSAYFNQAWKTTMRTYGKQIGSLLRMLVVVMAILQAKAEEGCTRKILLPCLPFPNVNLFPPMPLHPTTTMEMHDKKTLP